MQFRTLLTLVLILHCTHRAKILLNWFWNKTPDQFTDSETFSQLPNAGKNTPIKLLEKSYADFINLSIELHNAKNEGLVNLLKTQKSGIHIHESNEFSTERMDIQIEKAAIRLQRSLEKLAKINNTIDSIWNVTESMVNNVEQKLKWIDEYINNKNEQLNTIYQTAQHIVYLLGCMIVAAFLQAPFVTRLSIMAIVPLNFMVFLNHRSPESCLGFPFTTALIFVVTGVHFLMVNRKKLSNGRPPQQFLKESLMKVTKNQIGEYVITSIAAIEQLFKPQSVILSKDHEKLIPSRLPVQKDNVVKDYRTDELNIAKSTPDDSNSVKVAENDDSDSDEPISIVETSLCNLPPKPLEQNVAIDSDKKSNHSTNEEKFVGSQTAGPVNAVKDLDLVPNHPSKPEDKATYEKTVQTTHERSDIKPTTSVVASPPSITPPPLTGTRANQVGNTSINIQKYIHQPQVINLNHTQNWYTATVSAPSPALSYSNGLCGATTQKGTPCRNKPSYGGRRCWRH